MPGVGRGVRPPRPADRRLVEHVTSVVLLREAAVDQRALARAGDAGHGDEHAERDVDRDVAQVVQRRVLDPQRAGRLARRRPSACRPVAKCRPVSVSGRAQAARRRPRRRPCRRACPAPGPMSTTWSAIAITSGLCSTTSTVLPLSRSAHEQPVDLLHVVRVQADRGLVEHVGHVGEARAEVADHLHPLRLAAGERRRLAVEAQVAEPDLARGCRACRAAPSSAGRDRRGVDRGEQRREVVDLHRRALGDVAALDLRAERAPG